MPSRGTLVLALVACGVLSLPAPAAAASLDTDEITAPIESGAKAAADTLGDSVDDAGGAVEPMLDGAEKTLDPVVDEVRDRTRPVEDTVQNTIDEVIGQRGDDPRDDTGGSPKPPPEPRDDSAGATSGKGGDKQGKQGGKGRTGPDRDGGRRRVQPPAPTGEGRTGSAPAPVAVGLTSADAPAHPPGPVQRALDAVEPFAFPLSLAAAVLLFLAVQRRLDARDPKLAGIPDDEVAFG